MKRVIAAALLLATSQSASAQMLVSDFPTMPCDRFLKMPTQIQDVWANGFFVGVTNSAIAYSGPPLDPIVYGGPSFADLMRKYCSQHRSSTVLHVTEELIRAATNMPPPPQFPTQENKQ